MVKSVTEIKGSKDNHSKRLLLNYEFPDFYTDFISTYGAVKLSKSSGLIQIKSTTIIYTSFVNAQ